MDAGYEVVWDAARGRRRRAVVLDALGVGLRGVARALALVVGLGEDDPVRLGKLDGQLVGGLLGDVAVAWGWEGVGQQ